MPRRSEPPLDPFERAARRSDPQLAKLAETAAPPRGLRAPRLLLVFLVLVIVVALVRGGHRSTSLQRSCTTPGFALSATAIDLDSTVQWSATGPAANHVVLALDSPQDVPAEPLAGPAPLTDCLVRGVFAMQAHTGKHTLTLFVLDPQDHVVSRLSRAVTVR